MSDMNLPTIHPREYIVSMGELAFLGFVTKNKDWKELTAIEQGQILLSRLQSTFKYWLRAERYPEDPSRPSGLL